MENIVLNEDQLEVLEKLKKFVTSDNQHMFLMEGAAGCLGADTIIEYKRGKRTGGKPLSIKDIHEKFHKKTFKQKWRLQDIPTYLKSYNPETGEIVYNEMTDIWMSGVKKLYLLKTENGRELKLTMSHPLLTSSGFKKLEELKVGDEIIVQGTMRTLKHKERKGRSKRVVVQGLKYYPKGCSKTIVCPKTKRIYNYKRTDKSRLVVEASMNNLSYDEYINVLKNNKDNSCLKYIDDGLIVHHVDKNPFNNELCNLQIMTKQDHNALHGNEYKWNREYTDIDKISSIEFYNTEETYDISMKAPLDNFVLKNGLIVHNSGKTTTISKFINWIFEESSLHNIAMSSPTHKALKVVTEMCPPQHKGNITFSTLHSILGLKHEITKDGKEIFVRDKKVMTKFPFFELVIIDESSMIADQLFNEMEEQNYRKIKVLFVGDSNQINPVNHSMSIPMIEEKRKEFNIGHCRLNKIVRQAENNPIIKYSQKIVKNEFEFIPGKKEMVEDSGIVMLSESQNKVLQQLLQYYFSSSCFDEDANYCKVIAWRNVTVDFYNKLIRKFKYGPKAGKIVLDEKLIVDRPIKNDDYGVSFATNEDLVVKTIEVKEKKLYDDKSWLYYDCLVQGSDKSDNIHILHENENKRYSDSLKKLAKEAVDEKEIANRLKKWRKYYSFMENFAQVKYNYAITAHNSQGSTYDNCFVLQNDINLNGNEDELRRILYTAFTRPRKMLYIV